MDGSSYRDPVMVLGAARTPIAAFQGAFSTVAATALGSAAITAALDRARVPAAEIDEVLMGCVLPAGLGQAPARLAALGARLPDGVPCTTVSKVCGSGMRAVMMAHDAIVAGSARLAVAGGMESMTNAPYLFPKARGGARIGHQPMIDHMMFDGLEDATDVPASGERRSMGTFAEDCADHYGFTRALQDDYASESVRRAQLSVASGAFAWEIAPVTVAGRGGPVVVSDDEGPGRIDLARIPTLRPAFREGGSVTAASSSSINDGAAALVLGRASVAAARGITPLARIAGHASFAGPPAWFTTAPVHAIRRLLAKVGWSIDEVDLFEINEAFAVVALAAMQDCRVPREKLNVNGGAVALGHPIGASGARILVTLAGAMRARGARRGIAAICIGGGEATAIALELES